MRWLVFLFIFMFLQLNAEAFNALEENRRHQQSLEQQASRQYIENYQHTKYYKGRPDFLYFSSSRYTSSSSGRTNLSAKDKALYAKKGVKFKLSEEDKIKVLKDKQQQLVDSDVRKLAPEKAVTEAENPKNEVASKNVDYKSKAEQKTANEEKTVETSVKVQKKQAVEPAQDKNIHNADAE